VKLKEVIKKYPDSFIVLMPMLREAETGRPLTFRVLVVCFTADEAISAEKQYTLDGLEDVCVLPNYSWDIDFPPEETARLFRVLYGMTGISSTEAIRVLRVVYEVGDGGGSGDQ